MIEHATSRHSCVANTKKSSRLRSESTRVFPTDFSGHDPLIDYDESQSATESDKCKYRKEISLNTGRIEVAVCNGSAEFYQAQVFFVFVSEHLLPSTRSQMATFPSMQ
eukprot:scaffold18284_cov39-Cyclotella_meneghiniana.AAC.2